MKTKYFLIVSLLVASFFTSVKTTLSTNNFNLDSLITQALADDGEGGWSDLGFCDPQTRTINTVYYDNGLLAYDHTEYYDCHGGGKGVSCQEGEVMISYTYDEDGNLYDIDSYDNLVTVYCGTSE